MLRRRDKASDISGKQLEISRLKREFVADQPNPDEVRVQMEDYKFHNIVTLIGNSGGWVLDYPDLATHRKRADSARELRIIKEHVSPSERQNIERMENFFAEMSPVTSQINELIGITVRIQDDTKTFENTFVAAKRQQLQRQIQTMIRRSSQLISGLKGTMAVKKREVDAMVQEDKNHPLHSQTYSMWCKNEVYSLMRRFQNSLQTFLDHQNKFKSKADSDLKKQAKMMIPGVTEDEVDNILRSPQPYQMIQQMSNSVSVALSDRILVLDERQKLMQQLVDGISDVQQLFYDLSALVDEGQEKLDKISENVAQTRVHVVKGHKHLVKAEQYQKKRGKCCCWISICIAVVLGVVLLVMMLRK